MIRSERQHNEGFRTTRASQTPKIGPRLKSIGPYFIISSSMALSSHSAGTEEAKIPLIYRLFFLYLEPVSALLGAYFSFFNQPTYLSLTHLPSAPQNAIPISTQIVLSQLSNLYLLFAINESLVLRSTKDLTVWKTVLFGLLVADFGHLWSVKMLGWEVYWRFESWNAIDWGNIGFVYLGALMRSCFMLGIGVKTLKIPVLTSEKT